MKRLISILSILCFLASISVFTSCRGSKSGYKKVNSGPGMGNTGHKNRHVWGK